MLCIYRFCWYFLLSYDTFCITTSESLRNGLTENIFPLIISFLHRLQFILIWQEHLDWWYTLIRGISLIYCTQADFIKFQPSKRVIISQESILNNLMDLNEQCKIRNHSSANVRKKRQN